MTFSRRWIFCLAVVLSACSGAAPEEAAQIPGAPAPPTTTPTLDRVRSRDYVQCGVTTGVAGFSAPDAQGEWRGLDVDVCRAIAAAVLGDAMKVRFTPLTAAQRFTALQTGEVDVLSRITTITFQRDVQLGIEFPAINWYDGTTFIVPRSSNVKSVRDLDGATICVQPGTTNEVDVADYFRKQQLTFTPVVIERLEEVTNAYFAGRCDAFSQDQATLAAVRARAPKPADHLVLQFLNLVKNSSLAVAIGYPDLISITNTTLNQTGQPIEAIAVAMAVYLVISVGLSLTTNAYNAALLRRGERSS